MWGGRGEGVRKSKWGRGGMGWGGAGGVGDKNKFGLKCFLDDFKCYKVFFIYLFFLVENSTNFFLFFLRPCLMNIFLTKCLFIFLVNQPIDHLLRL